MRYFCSISISFLFIFLIVNLNNAYADRLECKFDKYANSGYSDRIAKSWIPSIQTHEIQGENIAWINVTNPLAGSDCYSNAVQMYQKMEKAFDCLLSVSEVRDYLFHNGKPINFKPNPWEKSQNLTGVVEMTFVINILKRNDMIKWGSCVGETPCFYYLNKLISWDIDSQEDFDFCEMIHSKFK